MAILEGEALVERMRAIACEAHEGQRHSFGAGSYFERHLEPVANIVRRMGYGALFIAGAYGHDLFEDTPVTGIDLDREDIPLAVIHAIELMTKAWNHAPEDQDAYLAGILTSDIATAAKFADTSFNYSWTILHSPQISDEKFREWTLEYAHNIAVLRPHLPLPDAVAA